MTETPTQASGHENLADESFISAEDLRNYMHQQEAARLNKELSAMDLAERTRAELVKKLSEPLDLTPERLHEIQQNLIHKIRLAAERGETEIMIMRFPNALCTDKGRALNNGDENWPDSLTGRPRQAYELWRDHLRQAHYKFKAQIVDWPNGLPGDVGLFISWA